MEIHPTILAEFTRLDEPFDAKLEQIRAVFPAHEELNIVSWILEQSDEYRALHKFICSLSGISLTEKPSAIVVTPEQYERAKPLLGKHAVRPMRRSRRPTGNFVVEAMVGSM